MAEGRVVVSDNAGYWEGGGGGGVSVIIVGGGGVMSDGVGKDREGCRDKGKGKGMVIGILRASVRMWVGEGEISVVCLFTAG